MKLRTRLLLILAVILVVIVIDIPREDKVFSAIGLKDTSLKVRQGLDLQGGANLLYQTDLSKTSAEDKQKAVGGVINVIQKRVNPTGTSEVVVQTSGSDKVAISLPGIKDVNQAIALIGKTAQLSFYEVEQNGFPQATDISGKDLDTATTDIDQQSGKPIITFTMKSESVQKFASLTTKINQSGGRLLILLDDQPLFNGSVSSAITDGKGQMQGFKDIKDAQDTTVLLNAGALPVPINLVEQRTVGASLGSESIQKSIIAGAIGLLAVVFFMIAYYRLAGVVASVALVIYTLINLAIFKLSGLTPFPIVLTLAGIAGFILSIGMAVDANILIFERMKEEVRAGSSLQTGLEDGFKRAWTSIRDSNISTLITCFILYEFSFGNSIVKGFAVTLAIGVLVSMFTAITVSKTFMMLLLQTEWASDPKMYRFNSKSNKAKVAKA
ncbi:protein translocase subunit SecD [Candidatus Saccharibacteria bacterium]|nr:protein translocase subunit SecD [Candidatus Saccharibacteria bacterium]